jgi:hypothetical protein
MISFFALPKVLSYSVTVASIARVKEIFKLDDTGESEAKHKRFNFSANTYISSIATEAYYRTAILAEGSLIRRNDSDPGNFVRERPA